MAQAGVPHQPGLYIGGLRHDLHPAKLATLIVSLLSKFQVQVAKRFVHITFKASEAFAIVELPDIKVSRNLLAQLSSTDNVLNVFDLSKITFHPSEFRVGPNLSQSPKYRSRSRSRPNRKNDTPVVDSTSCTTNHSSSSHSYGYGRRNRSSSNRRNRNRKKKCSGFSEATTSQSSSSHCDLQKPYKGIQRSRKSLQEADDDSSQSESDTDSSALSRDASSCSGVSGELEGKVDSSRRNFPLPDARPRAGGVQRLAQEFNVDPVSRSVSDRGIQPPVSKTSTTTSTTGLPLPSRVSVTTSTPGAGNGLVTNFYRVGQAIGRETRHSEFKQGGRLKDRAWLIDTVGKYVCGFLNSAEGGTLYIGVSDKVCVWCGCRRCDGHLLPSVQGGRLQAADRRRPQGDRPPALHPRVHCALRAPDGVQRPHVRVSAGAGGGGEGDPQPGSAVRVPGQRLPAQGRQPARSAEGAAGAGMDEEEAGDGRHQWHVEVAASADHVPAGERAREDGTHGGEGVGAGGLHL
ncbi:uncharacterized protein LOC143291127 isoform X3 [Babylonia areolata]|uniref:uncharacterized protein LOC143291127 isoform X3 n=1 Tax=Babylonia areolata TaxID=304850 RepID=UPI003FD4C962